MSTDPHEVLLGLLASKRIGSGLNLSKYRSASPESGSHESATAAMSTDQGNCVTGRRTLLVAEDEALIRRMLEEILKDAGFAVQAANDGTQATQLIESQDGSFCGVITDIRLGAGPNGWEVARHARVRRPDMPIIYITGDSAHEWVLHGVPNSILIQKPFVGRKVTAALAALLE